ncbi:MAG: type IV secretory system conjugative DNA transfer family protein [Phycisphaerales bacterium]
MVSTIDTARNAKQLPLGWRTSTPLLLWTLHDAWTVGQSFENCLILGATGSGKTSGSGDMLADAYIRAGYGGCICCSKISEMVEWIKRCECAGRGDDVILIEPGGKWKFNPLAYEMNRKGAGAGQGANVAALFDTLMELADRGGSSSSGREAEPYWRRAVNQAVRNAIALLIAADHDISFEAMYRVFSSAPQSIEEVRSPAWQKASFCYQLFRKAFVREHDAIQRHDFELASDFWFLEFANLASRTRSVVVSTFTSQVDLWQRGILKEIFGGETTFTPNDAEHGKIIIVGLPVKEYHELGRAANIVMRYVFQRALESRDITASPRPVFLWADEFQTLITSHDAQFLATCRSARVSTVLLTQNLPGVYAALGGGDKGKHEADAIFGNCNTKIFHSNSDPVTCEWMSNILGKSLQAMASGSVTNSNEGQWSSALGLDFSGQRGNTSAGFSESYQFEVQPAEFAQLRTGGKEHGRHVDAILFQNGRVFRQNGKTWLRVTFRQKS